MKYKPRSSLLWTLTFHSDLQFRVWTLTFMQLSEVKLPSCCFKEGNTQFLGLLF